MTSRNVCRATLVLLLWLPTAQHLHALDPTLRISQYHKQYWQVEQGLPHTYVTAIRMAPDGYLLVGTDEGLARFDGLNFRPVQADPALRLSRRWVSALLPARDGSLWVGTFDGQVVQLRDGRTLRSHQAIGSVFSLIQNTDGTVWASTRNGVFRIERERIRKEPALASPLETSWNVLSSDSEGGIWIVSSNGLFRYSSGSLSQRLANGGGQGEILSVLAGRGGNLWLGTTTGLFRYAPATDSPPVRVASLAGPVVSLLEDHDGVLWAGTWGRGLYKVAARRVERWAAHDGLPDDFIRNLNEDNEGNLWIGMRSGGLGQWTETRLVPVGTAEGMAGNYASTVATDRHGDLWLGTWRGGLYRLKGGRMESQPTPLPVLYSTVRALAFDAEGRQWIGNWEGVFQFDGVRYRRFASEPDSPYRRVSALLFDRHGALWIGTQDRGLMRFAGGRPHAPAPEPLLRDVEVTALLEDSAGTVWVGTTSGLVRVSPAGTVSNVPAQQCPREAVESLLEDSRKRIWAATAGGALAVISATGHRLLDRRHGLLGHPLYRVLEDSGGSFWVSSPRGILELPAEPLEQVLAGQRAELEIRTYDQDDGMRTIECHGLSQPAGWRCRDGDLWFPTARGFVQVRRAKLRGLAPPRALVEQVRTGARVVPVSRQIDLPAGSRNLEVEFTALRFSGARKVQFRYRMTGLDPDWVVARTQRNARYNQLPPGLHAFEVQARDPAGDWGPPAKLAFRQIPRFHQTWWFTTLLGVAAVAGAMGFYRWRLHVVHGRYAAVLEERNRIGREWHDTLVAGFSAISLQLEAALLRLREEPGRASDILEVTRKMVHHYRAEARRVIWDLRDSRPDGETLPAAVQSAFECLVEARGITGGVTVTGDPRDLPPELQHNVLRICQEAMVNAVRHGKPSRVEVELGFSGKCVTASVRDDGCGFAVSDRLAESGGHFGLAVMRERARRIGGRLSISSGPGQGTIVKAVIPVEEKATA